MFHCQSSTLHFALIACSSLISAWRFLWEDVFERTCGLCHNYLCSASAPSILIQWQESPHTSIQPICPACAQPAGALVAKTRSLDQARAAVEEAQQKSAGGSGKVMLVNPGT